MSHGAFWRRRRSAHEEARASIYVGRIRGTDEWRWAVLMPGGRREWGDAESAKDAWLDATQVLRNARGYR